MMRRTIAWLIGLALVTACVAPSAPKIRVEGAWARPAAVMEGMSGMGGGTSAVYFTLVNEGAAPDALVGTTAGRSVAASAEVHETTMASSVMKMQSVPRVEVPAGGKVEFKPGGFHVMLIGLRGELKVGNKIPLVLHFEKSPDISVEAEVRAP